MDREKLQLTWSTENLRKKKKVNSTGNTIEVLKRYIYLREKAHLW